MSDPRSAAEYHVWSSRTEIGRIIVGGYLIISYMMTGPDGKKYFWSDKNKIYGKFASSSEHAIEMVEQFFTDNAVIEDRKPSTEPEKQESRNSIPAGISPAKIPRLRNIMNGEVPKEYESVVAFDYGGATAALVTYVDGKFGAVGFNYPRHWRPLWIPTKELFQFLKSGGE